MVPLSSTSNNRIFDSLRATGLDKSTEVFSKIRPGLEKPNRIMGGGGFNFVVVLIRKVVVSSGGRGVEVVSSIMKFLEAVSLH